MSKKRQRHKGRIATTYEIITPESAAEGDVAEAGWEDEVGEPLSPAEAIRFLEDRGARDASSTQFHPGVWYSESDPDIDYSTGEETRRSFHLKGYTPNQQRRIFEAIVGPRTRRTTHARSR